MVKRRREPDPELLAELYEALDAMEAAAKALQRKRREIFPEIRAHQKCVKRVREIWKDVRGKKADAPGTPLLDAARANGQAARDKALAKLRGKETYDAAMAEAEGAAEQTRKPRQRATR